MQAPTPSSAAYSDDEVSLSEIWQTLVKRKWLVVAVFVVCLLGGIAFLINQQPVYEASVSLKIGHVTSNQGEDPFILLENPAELTARLSVQGGVKAVLQKGSNNIVSITSSAVEAGESTEHLKRVIDEVIESHRQVFEQNTQPVKERLSQLVEQKRAFESELAAIEKLVDQLKIKDPVQASVLLLQRSSVNQALYQVDADSLRLSQQVSSPKTKPTELLGEIMAPAKPSKPKKILVLALAAMLGLMGGVMLAFVMEFVAKAKGSQSSIGS